MYNVCLNKCKTNTGHLKISVEYCLVSYYAYEIYHLSTAMIIFHLVSHYTNKSIKESVISE